jgi:hypothetical protein
MRLASFFDDAGLNGLRSRMGAALGTAPSVERRGRLTVVEFEKLISGGIDIQNLDEVRTLSDGTLAYKDQRVLLYIRDVPTYRSKGASPNDLPKFHVSNCKKLQDMRSQNRYGRYVVAARQDGTFQINKIEHPRSTTSLETLYVCQFCLGRLRWNNFSHDISREMRLRIVRTFLLSDFFLQYPRDLVDAEGLDSESTAPLNDYTGDFGVHADAVKARSGYSCTQCLADLSAPQRRKYLHAHHMNGVKYDNSQANLVALCIACHAAQPMHSHMLSLPDYDAFMRLR